MSKKKILITGASCFIGYHLVKALHKKNYRIYSTISKKLNSYTGVRKKRLALLKNLGLNFYKVDLLKKNKVKQLLKKTNPDYIFHLASVDIKDKKSKRSLLKSIKKNMKFVENLYNLLERKKNTKIIIVSTNAEYAKKEGKVSESSSCNPPFNNYGLSKLSASLRALYLGEIKKIQTIIVRVFNPIGPLDSDKKLLPQVIKSLNENKTIKLSPCNHKRDFIYIDRLIDGLIKLIHFAKTNRKYKVTLNLCYGKPTEIKSLLIKIAKLLNSNKKLLKFGVLKMRKEEPFVNYGDNIMAKNKLFWKTGNLFEDITKWIKKNNDF